MYTDRLFEAFAVSASSVVAVRFSGQSQATALPSRDGTGGAFLYQLRNLLNGHTHAVRFQRTTIFQNGLRGFEHGRIRTAQ